MLRPWRYNSLVISDSARAGKGLHNRSTCSLSVILLKITWPEYMMIICKSVLCIIGCEEPNMYLLWFIIYHYHFYGRTPNMSQLQRQPVNAFEIIKDPIELKDSNTGLCNGWWSGRDTPAAQRKLAWNINSAIELPWQEWNDITGRSQSWAFNSAFENNQTINDTWLQVHLTGHGKYDPQYTAYKWDMLNTMQNHCILNVLQFDRYTPPFTGQPALETTQTQLTILCRSGRCIGL